MTDVNIEGYQGPVSDTMKQALEELQAQGHEFKNNTSGEIEEAQIETPEPEKVVEEEKVVEQVPEPVKKEEEIDETTKRPEREVSYVPAYKLKIAESQKEALTKKLEALEQNKQTPTQTQQVTPTIQAIADEYGIDPEFLAKMQQVLTPKDVQEKLERIEKERVELHQEKSFADEFEKDVVPMLKAENPDLTIEALSHIKEELRPFAFSEEYAKLSLSKIFKAEREAIKIPQPTAHKKTVESARSGIARSDGVVDFDNITEAEFAKLSPEKILEFAQYKARKK